MTSISSISQLAAYARRQAETAKRPTATGSSDKKAFPTAATAGSALPNTADLEGAVTARIALIDASRADAPRLAFRAYLEIVLRAELGAQMGGEGAFYEIVDRVWRDMEDDSALSEAMESAGAVLLAAAKTAGC